MSTSLASNSWRPAASLRALQARAALLKGIRSYFDDRDVLEVCTPAMSRAATTDLNIASFQVPEATLPAAHGRAPQHCYLHTSPEFAMKRLLCAGSGDIYQICSVFRAGEAGSRHNPEFQLLEWYRLGFTPALLMDEIESLLVACLSALESFSDASSAPVVKAEFQRRSYFSAIHRATGLSQTDLNRDSIGQLLEHKGIDNPLDSSDPLDSWLDLLMSACVAATFPSDSFTFIYDYPASQSALARLRETRTGAVAERFELFFGELELANGFYELADSLEQKNRFLQDNQKRQAMGLEAMPYDKHLIAALESGLPDCSGVAIGIDRLLMVLIGSRHITDVQSFPIDRA